MEKLKAEVRAVLTNADSGKVALHKVDDKHHKRRDGEKASQR